MKSLPLLTLVSFLTVLQPLAPGQLVPPDATDGKTTLSYENEPFISRDGSNGGLGFVKFAMILSEPSTVYFQDSNLFPFHYDFASQRLQPFLGMARPQFDAVSLRRPGQQVVLGAVIFPPFGGPREYGVQFVGLDAYPKEDVKAWIDVVKSAVLANPSVTALYLPAFEQREQAEADRVWFEGQGIGVATPERWLVQSQIYAPGWALGRLVFVPGDQIAELYGTDALRPGDVLLTDAVPAEIPFTAAVLTQTPATPNSHVVILARNQRIPFAWVAREEERQRIESLVGKEVLVRIQAFGDPAVSVSAVDDDLDPKLREKLLRFKQPPPAEITARKSFGALSEDVTELTPRDIRVFGGKASNFGLLRRKIPDNSPQAMAFSFDLWEAFLENINPDSGKTLRQEIRERLGGFSYPPDFAAARLQLEEVRDLIRKKVKFTDAQKDAIIAALLDAGFQSTRMLRFRSSTNVEDTEQLTGAGLYESFSGCIADSTDGNNEGPCGCAGGEPEEKTVLDAIEKVFASFYSENAWLERLRFGVKESEVGMAVLVHENFPDEQELANGVATIKRTRSSFGSTEFQVEIVTQLGAVDVANPSGGARPEVVSGGQSEADGEPFVFTQQRSDLVQLGANVMTWETDYHELMSLMVKTAEGYAQIFPGKDEFTLDFEFKKMEPGKLWLKQVREVLEPEPRNVAPFLLNNPGEFVVLQGESGDAFAFHRLKSVLAAETINKKVNAASIGRQYLSSATIRFLVGEEVQELTGSPASWPGYRFTARTTGRQITRWRAGAGADFRTLQLKTAVPMSADASISPAITQNDFTFTLSAIYRKPQPYIDFEGEKTRTSEAVRLVRRGSLIPAEEVQTRRIATPGGVAIDPQFRWPDYRDSGFIIIKTFPLAAWEQTTITGLTTDPLVLTSEFSQTYAPGHHNFFEVFLFEPRLDPGVTPAQRTELEAADIRMIYVNHDTFGGGDPVKVVGFDGAVRDVP